MDSTGTPPDIQISSYDHEMDDSSLRSEIAQGLERSASVSSGITHTHKQRQQSPRADFRYEPYGRYEYEIEVQSLQAPGSPPSFDNTLWDSTLWDGQNQNQSQQQPQHQPQHQQQYRPQTKSTSSFSFYQDQTALDRIEASFYAAASASAQTGICPGGFGEPGLFSLPAAEVDYEPAAAPASGDA
ncbi:hypothetical protein I317_05339 [Kwoniella heveanensis CBS 569]|nr:hypothetical protein I317_05339 [Kwoniella heveanensis CBS 569]